MTAGSVELNGTLRDGGVGRTAEVEGDGLAAAPRALAAVPGTVTIVWTTTSCPDSGA